MADAGNGRQEQRKGDAAKFYSSASTTRDPYLQRARRLSQYTVPGLFREAGAGGSTQEELGWNSSGAYLAANFASTFIFALFPPGRAPMKLNPDRGSIRALQEDASIEEDRKAELTAAIALGLSGVEKEFSECMEEDGDRAKLTVGALRMIIGGQQGFQTYTDGTLRGIPLDRHVTKRDPQGTVIAFGIEDGLSFATIPKAIQDLVKSKGFIPEKNHSPAQEPVITVYTYGVLKEDGRWEVYEECWGEEVPGSRRFWSAENLPYFFPPWQLFENEDYGRSYAEWYEADLQTVEGITQTIVEGGAAMARFLILVAPGAMTSKKSVAEAANGAVLTGKEGDITSPDFSRSGANFMVSSQEKDKAMDRLSKAFLLPVQRDAERVTAEEVRLAAALLEKAQAGVYSQQVVSFQAPYARLKLSALQRSNRVTKLPQKQIKMTILGGLAALGRNSEADGLRQWGQECAGILGPQWMQLILTNKPARIIATRLAAAYGVDGAGIIPTPKEAEEAEAKQQQQMLMQSMGPQAVQAAGNYLTDTTVADTNAQGKVAVEQQKQMALPAPASSPGEA